MTGPGSSGAAGAAGAGTTCSSGVQQTIIVDCGYPYTSSNVLTSVTFNESDVLRAIQPSGSASSGVVRLFYNDEHALTLGVRSVVVKTASGSTTTDYTVSPLPADPGSVTSPQTGTNVLAGAQSGLDPSLRPMWPSLFITDVSVAPTSRVGDWQQGGRPSAPNAVYGTWKAAVRTVDETVSPARSQSPPTPTRARTIGTSAGRTRLRRGSRTRGTAPRWSGTFRSPPATRIGSRSSSTTAIKTRPAATRERPASCSARAAARTASRTARAAERVERAAGRAAPRAPAPAGAGARTASPVPPARSAPTAAAFPPSRSAEKEDGANTFVERAPQSADAQPDRRLRGRVVPAMPYIYEQLFAVDLPALKALLALFGEAFGEPDTYQGAVPTDAYLAALLGKPHFIALAALRGGEVVGGLAAYELEKFEQARSEIYIYDLAVREDRSPQGGGDRSHSRAGAYRERARRVRHVRAGRSGRRCRHPALRIPGDARGGLPLRHRPGSGTRRALTSPSVRNVRDRGGAPRRRGGDWSRCR